MSAAEKMDDGEGVEPATMRTARAMISAGYRPIPIYPGKKKPIGEGWGLILHVPEKWRDPTRGLGVLLGDDGQGGGLIDFEIDDPARALAVINRIFPDGIPDTPCFRANLGMHYFFRYDNRLSKYGQTIIKGEIDRATGSISGNPHYVGVEFRFGTIDPKAPVQEQSVIPPTPRADGTPREWMMGDGEFIGPDAVFAGPIRFLPLPECVFADLDRFAVNPRSSTAPEADSSPSWDKEDVKAAILPHARDLALEWGLRITGTRATAKGFLECRAIDRPDSEPSCGFNPTTGVYTDRKTGTDLSIFQLALALRAYPDFPSCVNTLGRRFKVPPTSASARDDPTSGGFGSSGGDSIGSKSWKYPRLHSPTPAVPFPLEILPPPLAALCRDGAESFQCPADYFAVAALALAGAGIGMTVNLALKPGYFVPPHLFVALVGPPGTRKSPVLHKLARPFYDIDHDLRETYRAEKAEYDIAMQAHEAAKKRGQNQAPPLLPNRRQLTMDDATREAVALIHSENLRGLVVVKDELTSWVASLNAYKPSGKGDDKQFWLSINSGMPIKVDRKGGASRDSIVVPRPCVMMVGGLTPDMLPTVRNGGGDDGWLDRILFSYPEPIEPGDWSEDVIGEPLVQAWEAAVRRLWSRAMTRDDRGRDMPHVVDLSPSAKSAWAGWFNDHQAEKRHRDFPATLRGPWSKIEGYAGRLTLTLSQLHRAYDPTDELDDYRDVGERDVERAVLAVEYFKAHFRRARNELSSRPESIPDDAAAILKWLCHPDRRPSTFSERDVRHNFTGRFGKNPTALSDATSWLERHECIRRLPAPGQKTGRPHSDLFEVNPLIFGGEDEDGDAEGDSPQVYNTYTPRNSPQNGQNRQNSGE